VSSSSSMVFSSSFLSSSQVVSSSSVVATISSKSQAVSSSSLQKVEMSSMITKLPEQLKTTITSISLDCQLQTKFLIGNCNILNQNGKVVANFDNNGNTKIVDKEGNKQRIISYFAGYGSCSYTEREFDFITTNITTLKESYNDCYYPELKKLILN
jgi:hypothetical protein